MTKKSNIIMYGVILKDLIAYDTLIACMPTESGLSYSSRDLRRWL